MKTKPAIITFILLFTITAAGAVVTLLNIKHFDVWMEQPITITAYIVIVFLVGIVLSLIFCTLLEVINHVFPFMKERKGK